MLQHLNSYLTFPTAEEDQHQVRERFCAIAGFPNVIRCVKRTHLSILTPHILPTLYLNHSLKVEVTCDA